MSLIIVYTKDPKKGRVTTGYFDSSRNTLILPKDRTKHYMRIVEGYGMQLDVYERAVKRDCLVEIQERGGAVYRSHITDWLTHGKSADYSHGKQRFLSLKFMKQ